ncbi:unnamed protein product, partial [Rotaria sp. Silwood1]
MSLSEESNKFAHDKIQWLLENQCRIPVRSTTPIHYYYKTSDTLIDQADYYYQTNQFEQSFILYSRYITLFVEELKKYHRDFPNVSINDRERVKDIIRTKAFPRAEELKEKLKEKYIREYQEKQKTTDENEEDYSKISVSTLTCAPITSTYDCSQELITNSINSDRNFYGRISIPNDITAKFIEATEQNTARNIETYGILGGYKKNNNEYIITDIIIPKQNDQTNSSNIENENEEEEEEIFKYILNNNLIILGWIHTHPNERVYLSNIDLHKHLSYQMLIPESIAIVISPIFNQTVIYSLTYDIGIPI